MKIREGFVSNSSSTSFIVCLPKDFNPDDAAILAATQKVSMGEYEWTPEEIDELKGLLNILCSGREVWIPEVGDNIEALKVLIEDWIVAKVDSGPDAGTISPMSDEEVEKARKIFRAIESKES